MPLCRGRCAPTGSELGSSSGETECQREPRGSSKASGASGSSECQLAANGWRQ